MEADMKCPNCKLVNPDSATRCDCGYDFATGQVHKAIVAAAGVTGAHDVRSIVRGYKVNAILGQRWGALIVDIFVLLIVFVCLAVAIKGNSDWPLILWSLFLFLYFVVPEGKWGVTLGKLAAKLRVVTADGAAPGYGRATVRMLLRLVEVNPILAGGIPAGIVVALSEHRQRLGDMLAGTYVLNRADVDRSAKAR
jgi:uncharacterized RDD family membrane protein YckC